MSVNRDRASSIASGRSEPSSCHNAPKGPACKRIATATHVMSLASAFCSFHSCAARANQATQAWKKPNVRSAQRLSYQSISMLNLQGPKVSLCLPQLPATRRLSCWQQLGASHVCSGLRGFPGFSGRPRSIKLCPYCLYSVQSWSRSRGRLPFPDKSSQKPARRSSDHFAFLGPGRRRSALLRVIHSVFQLQ